MNKPKSIQFAAGWLNQTKDGNQYIACKANGQKAKVKLMVQTEDGETIQVNSFAVFFNGEKQNEKAPDVQFVFNPNQQ